METSQIVELEKKDKAQNGIMDVQMLLQSAIEKNVPVDTMERLLAMRRELKAEWAKEQYDYAMSKFQSECPTIQKTKEVHTKSGLLAYKYAPIESIVEQVKVLLEKHGFSYAVHQELKERLVKITCRVTHKDGHSADYDMEVPVGDKTPIMSDSQVVAAASTFAKRYAFCNAFGILTGDEDTDARTIQTQDSGKKILDIDHIKTQMNGSKNIDELKTLWVNLKAEYRDNVELLALKDEMKSKLMPKEEVIEQIAKDMGGKVVKPKSKAGELMQQGMNQEVIH